MTAPCDCDRAGWCPRHQRNKSRHHHALCRNDETYRAIWNDLARRGIVEAFIAAKVTPARNPDAAVDPCAHLGEKLKSSKCGCSYECLYRRPAIVVTIGGDCMECEVYE